MHSAHGKSLPSILAHFLLSTCNVELPALLQAKAFKQRCIPGLGYRSACLECRGQRRLPHKDRQAVMFEACQLSKAIALPPSYKKPSFNIKKLISFGESCKFASRTCGITVPAKRQFASSALNPRACPGVALRAASLPPSRTWQTLQPGNLPPSSGIRMCQGIPTHAGAQFTGMSR